MRLQGLFLNNWVLKLLSLGFAVFLWFFVVGEEKAEVTITMPTEIVNLPKNLVVANDIPDMIYVRVLGPRSVIRDMVLQRLPKIIDLKNATARQDSGAHRLRHIANTKRRQGHKISTVGI